MYEEAKENLFTTIESLGEYVDNIKSDEISLRVGNKIFKLISTGEEFSIEDDIRKEYKDKIREKIKEIKKRVESGLEVINHSYKIKIEELDRLQKDLERKLKSSSIMPEINWDHASQGLSVVKGNFDGEFIWLYQGLYNPKTIDGKFINKKYIKKMIQNVIFQIRTKDDNIVSINVLKPIGMGAFRHYHERCWGSWNFSKKKWKTPDDIIAVAKEAESVLTNINTLSLANRLPLGLPRIETLKKNLVDSQEDIKLTSKDRRSGLSADIINDNDEWGA